MKLKFQVKNKIFLDLKEKIDAAINKEVLLMGNKTALRDACEYALLNGGKRFRPIITCLIVKNLNNHYDSMNAAIACEFFHTASLIADDLPCMDDEKKRRNKPALHLAFEENLAILASYALISAGYKLIYKNAKVLEKTISRENANNICVLAIECVSKHAGIHGAVGGQFLDLYASDINMETIKEIINKKTVSLFEISFSLGWLFGGGDIKKLELVRKCSYHFGMAFQIADDIKDFKQDLKKEKNLNIAIALGKERALEALDEELKKAKELLIGLNLFSDEFKVLLTFIKDRV